MLALQILNAIAAGISVAFAATALVRPTVLSRSVTAGPAEVLFARMYAVRAIPLGIAVAVVPFFTAGLGVAMLVLVAGVVQLADTVVLVKYGERGRAVGPVLAGGVHIALAVLLLL